MTQFKLEKSLLVRAVVVRMKVMILVLLTAMTKDKKATTSTMKQTKVKMGDTNVATVRNKINVASTTITTIPLPDKNVNMTNEVFYSAGDTSDVILDATQLPDAPYACIGLESSAHVNVGTSALIRLATSASTRFNSYGLAPSTSIRLDSSSCSPVQEVVTGKQNVERNSRLYCSITLTIISIMIPSFHCNKN